MPQRLNFRWVVGQSVSQQELDEALERMRDNFPKPHKIPFIPWSIGEIYYYVDIENFGNWNSSEKSEYLRETGEGTSAFGRLKIWVDWFHYFLPDLVENATKANDISYDATEFCYHLYPSELFEEYFGFHKDIFNTLMKSVMHEKYWKNGDLKLPDWAEELEDYEYQPEWYEESPMYECLKFCVKYLPEKDLAAWVESIVAIDGKVWIANLRYWIKRLQKISEIFHIPSHRAELFLKEIRKYPQYADI